jgi:colanic acid/amylovoran biosynthesis glycosyltransferase
LENARRRIEERGLSQSIELLGYQPHNKVIEEMLDSHIFFMPFKTAPDGDKEGIPNSVKEASATGLPVVSTFHSGVPEAVLDGKTGLLADEEEEDALVGKLSYLIENQDVWSIFGKAGRELMEKEFDIIKETEKLEGFYSKLLA